MKTLFWIVGVVLLFGVGVAGQTVVSHATVSNGPVTVLAAPQRCFSEATGLPVLDAHANYVCREAVEKWRLWVDDVRRRDNGGGGDSDDVLPWRLRDGSIATIGGPPSPVASCSTDDTRRAMNRIRPYVDTAAQEALRSVQVPAVGHPWPGSADDLRRRADELDAKEKAINDFQAVLACLNAKEHR